MQKHIPSFVPKESLSARGILMSVEKLSIWFSLGIAIVVIAVVVPFASLHSPKQTRTVRDVNALLVIAPYKYQGAWVFDDPAVGLSREPFIAGIDTMIDKAVADILTVSRWLNHQDGGALAMKTYGHLRREHSTAAALKVAF